MKKLLFIFCILSASTYAQDLKLISASRQTINYGASPSSNTNYKVVFEKNKKFIWSIDSICGIQSGNLVKYHIVKISEPTVLSPDYRSVEVFRKADQGKYQIRFSVLKQRGSGRPGSPPMTKADTTNIEGGIIIYYSAKKKHKQLKVIEFEMLETVDAP